MAPAPEFNDDFRDALRELLEAQAEFVVVGAHAVAAHGVPRATGDIDILVRPTADNAERVTRALKQFGAPLDAHGVETQDFSKPGTVYQMGLPPRRIDILTEISGVSFDRAWDTRISVELGGMQIPVLGRDALLENKRATGRDKDLLDVRALTGDS